MMDKPFQRKGSKSNTHVGKEFERSARIFFAKEGIQLERGISIPIGINGLKDHEFDLGSIEQKILVECKSHTWTETGNVPSAKMMAWNQAMYYFYATPGEYRKIFFVLKDFSVKRQETLADYYIRTYYHLIPKDVEIWEMEENLAEARRIK
jgi:hypothetical protein